MRIIAGQKKGMKLLSPKTDVSRPITDRIKESLFNVLYNYDMPAGKTAADLFCGVGSLGLEALSRGAEFVAFVERDKKVVDVLKKNIAKAGFERQSKVIIDDAFRIIAAGGLPPGRQYNLVFVDPPYENTKDAGSEGPLGLLLETLHQCLRRPGLVVVRTAKTTELLDKYGQLEIIDRRVWGTMAISLLSQARQ